MFLCEVVVRRARREESGLPAASWERTYVAMVGCLLEVAAPGFSGCDANVFSANKV
jgi:hypothetical protein